MLLISSLIVALVFHNRSVFIPASSIISTGFSDRHIILSVMEKKTGEGFYTLEIANENLSIQDYTSEGSLQWRKKLPVDVRSITAISDFSGSRSVYLFVPQITEQGGIPILSLTGRRAVEKSNISQDSLEDVRLAAVVPFGGRMLVSGFTEQQSGDSPTAIHLNENGSIKWRKIEHIDGHYTNAAVDSQGNLIAAGDIFGNGGTLIAKYTADGKRLWLKQREINDGGYTVWVRAGKLGIIHTIVRLHYGPHQSSWLSQLLHKSGSEDHSEQEQEYSYIVYGPDGHIIKQATLCCGPSFHIVDASLDQYGNLYTVANGVEGGNAKLLKIDYAGKIRQSGIVRLPLTAFVQQMILDKSGFIYLSVVKRNKGSNDRARGSFVYKVKDFR